jgi:hypothetical protein
MGLRLVARLKIPFLLVDHEFSRSSRHSEDIMLNKRTHPLSTRLKTTFARNYYQIWQLTPGDVICLTKSLKRNGIDHLVKIQTTVVSVRQIEFLSFELIGKANLVTAPNGKQDYRAFAVSYRFPHDFVVGALVKH